METDKQQSMVTVKEEYTITLYTENQVGLLTRVSIIFSRRKINIESISAAASEAPGIYRMTIVITESRETVRKLCMQLEKNVEVLKAYYSTNEEIIWQEMALYKLQTSAVTEKVQVERLLRQYGARAVVIRSDYTVFETVGHREEIDNLTAALEPFGLIEFVRSARVAIIKASEGFHKLLTEFETKEPSPEVAENEYLNKGANIFTV